jgi:hypothetical protein
MLKDLKTIIKLLGEIKELLTGKDEITDLEKEYREYKFFADSRGEKLLAEQGLLDEYNSYMTELENILFSDVNPLSIELPKPSPALEKFKNKFNKFF